MRIISIMNDGIQIFKDIKLDWDLNLIWYQQCVFYVDVPGVTVSNVRIYALLDNELKAKSDLEIFMNWTFAMHIATFSLDDCYDLYRGFDDFNKWTPSTIDTNVGFTYGITICGCGTKHFCN